MFGSKRRAEKKAAEVAAEKARAQAELRTNLVDLIAIAEGGVGDATDWPLVLKPGERLVYAIQGGGLFEPRRLPGHWEGRSAGVSIPVVDGIRVRVGKSAGTLVQGDEVPTTIDTGDVSVTTQRVVFQGSKYSREWLYAKLLGIMHYADQPRTAIQVSNREKTSGIVYTDPVSGTVRLRLAVAVSIFNGEGQQTARHLRDELGKLDSGETAATLEVGAGTDSPPEPRETAVTSTSRADGTSEPTGPDSSPQPSAHDPPTLAPPPPPPPEWAPDPTGRHQLRYWDGKAWTDHVSDQGRESRDPLPTEAP